MIDNTYPDKIISRTPRATATWFRRSRRITLVTDIKMDDFDEARTALADLEREVTQQNEM